VRIRVNPAVCQGHTLCVMTAPALFRLREEDGHALVAVDEVPPELFEMAHRAVLGCPEGAIEVIEDEE
jgi:ferredoxin